MMIQPSRLPPGMVEAFDRIDGWVGPSPTREIYDTRALVGDVAALVRLERNGALRSARSKWVQSSP